MTLNVADRNRQESKQKRRMRWSSGLRANEGCWWVRRLRPPSLPAGEQIAKQEAGQAGRPATIVTVLPDSADKYLSERFWEEA